MEKKADIYIMPTYLDRLNLACYESVRTTLTSLPLWNPRRLIYSLTGGFFYYVTTATVGLLSFGIFLSEYLVNLLFVIFAISFILVYGVLFIWYLAKFACVKSVKT